MRQGGNRAKAIARQWIIPFNRNCRDAASSSVSDRAALTNRERHRPPMYLVAWLARAAERDIAKAFRADLAAPTAACVVRVVSQRWDR
jgi:hypothetical protein